MKGWKDFSENITFRIGDGSRVHFWEHKWCGENILKEDFPNIYGVSCQRELTVRQIHMFNEGEVHWDLRFRRDLQD